MKSFIAFFLYRRLRKELETRKELFPLLVRRYVFTYNFVVVYLCFCPCGFPPVRCVFLQPSKNQLVALEIETIIQYT